MRLPRLRFTTSVRSLLLLILVLGLGLGWMANKARRQRRGVAEVTKYNGHVEYDYEYANGKRLNGAKPGAPAWLRSAFGDEYFQEVSRVIYVDQPISDATLAPLNDLSGIEELCFLSRMGHHTLPEVMPPPGLDKLTESGLSRLEGLTRLRRLELVDIELTGSMLRHLNRSAQLEELKIFEGDGIEGGITDEGMPPLSAMPRLRVLSLWCHRITGSCLKPLQGSTGLVELQFYGSPLSPAGFENIGAITNLKDLYFNQVDVSDANLRKLRNLTGLTRLTLDNRGKQSNVTDAGLVYLAGMTRLECLDLTDCKITGQGLASLKKMNQLKRLCLGWTQIDDSGLEVIAGFSKLEELELHQTKVTDAGLVLLRRLKNLKTLSLVGTAVTPQAIDQLKKAIPALAQVR
jgi:hypothetical protein